MSELILFSFASVGLTNILIYGKIFEGLREKLRQYLPEEVYEVLECYQCTGFWAGLVAGYAILSSNFWVVLMAGFASSFLSEMTQVIRDYLEANSVVDLPPPQSQEEFLLHEDVIRTDHLNTEE